MWNSIPSFFARIVQELVTYSMQSAPAHEILPGLWLGNKGASQDVNWLQANNIGAIFNCTKDLPFAMDTQRHLYRVPVDDNLQDDEIRNLEHWSWEIVYKIHKELISGNRVLVHCFAGMQRSAAVVAMLVISRYRCTTDEAIAFVKSKRPVAFFGFANFYKAIKGFETSLRAMITKDGTHQSFQRVPLPTDAVTNS